MKIKYSWIDNGYSLKSYFLTILFLILLIQIPVVVFAQKSIPMTTIQRSNSIIENISGIVTDEKGNPVIGATVVNKETGKGTSTDSEGKFLIAVKDSNSILVVSFLGFQTKEIKAGVKVFVTIILKEEIKALNEVVITGIFTRKANSYTGSVSSLSKEQLESVGNTNIISSIKNLDPSFQILESNDFGSDPNKLPDIQIRGASSFSDMKDKYQTSPNQPLFIIDGFEQSLTKVMDLDMNLVASVTILKDATAKTLYGSKGANGVIVIETIPPKQGNMRLSYNGNFNVQYADLTSYNLANAREKLEIERLSGVYTSDNALSQQSLNEQYQNLLKEVERGVNTYWLDKPLHIGLGQKHSLRLEGGNDDIRYNFNLSYNNIQGVMIGSERKTIEGSMQFSYRYKSLLFKNNLSITNTNSQNSPYGTFSEYAKLNPYWRPYNEDGSIHEILGSYAIANAQGYKNIYNPLINANLNTKDDSSYIDITNNFYIEWSVINNLKLVGQLGFTRQTSSAEKFIPPSHTTYRDITINSDDYFKRGLYTMNNGKSSDINADLRANYSKSFGKHLLFINGQWSISETSYDDVAIQAQGFANDNLDNITQALEYKESSKPSGAESLTRETSLLGSLNYSYNERYLLDYSYRANASSLFGADKRWGQFWSLGLGWNIHNESFMKKLKAIDKLKLRFSTGFSGAQNFQSYQALATYKYYNDVTYDYIIGSYLLGLSNSDLQWQKTQDNNVGFDLSLLNAIDLTVDVYQKNTDNLLTPVAIPSSTGFASYIENLGKTQNTGIEARLNYRIIKDSKRQIYFSVFSSVAHNKNKLVKISNALTSLNEEKDSEKGSNNDHENGKSTTIKPSVRYEEGQSMSAIWAVRSLGIDPMNGNEIFLKKDGTMTYTWDANDQVVCGDGLPKVSGTFGFNFEFKGFTVNASSYFRFGGQYYNTTLVEKVENADIQYNVDKRMLSDRWSTPGVAAKYKKFSQSATFTRPTSRFVQDYTELQLTSVNVGYNFRNQKWLKNLKMEQLKVSVYTNDLLRTSTVKAERGIEYPFSRTISGSIQVVF